MSRQLAKPWREFQGRMTSAFAPDQQGGGQMMKALITASLCAGSLWCGFDLAHAQPYPNRPIKMVVPFPPGGPTDGMARIVSDRLGPVLGQSVVVENQRRRCRRQHRRQGRSRRADPDGYTILITPGGALTTGPAVHKNIGYDPVKVFTPVALVDRGRRSSSPCTRTPAGEIAGRCRGATPKPIRARSAGARRASARRRTCSPRCSSSTPASTSCTCPIAGRHRCSPPLSPARCRSSPIR